MPDYKLSEAAEQDYFNILDFTFERWGYQQFLKYSGLLRKTLQKLAAQPNLGHHLRQTPKELLGYAVGRHVIFYRQRENGIDVARILHDRMNFKTHLKGH